MVPLPVRAADQRFVWGQVQDAQTRQPIPDSLVQDPVTHAASVTDPQGYFFLPLSGQDLVVSRTGYQRSTFRMRAPSLRATTDPQSARRALPFGQSQNVILLRPLPPSPVVPLLGSQVSVALFPGIISEIAATSTGSQNPLGGAQPLGLTVRGDVRLGPVLIGGALAGESYSLQRGDTQQLIGRLQDQGELEALYCYQWHPALAVAIGPSVLFDRIDLLNAPSVSGRAADYLDVAMSRLSAGLEGRIAVALPTNPPLAIDGRLAIRPLATVLSTQAFEGAGLWSLSGSLGVRWFPMGPTGFDGRYTYQSWQSPAYYQGLHSLSLGVITTF